MLRIAAVWTAAQVVAYVLGLLTWEAVALAVCFAAMALAVVALVTSREALRRTEAFQAGQSDRIGRLEPRKGD